MFFLIKFAKVINVNINNQLYIILDENQSVETLGRDCNELN